MANIVSSIPVSFDHGDVESDNDVVLRNRGIRCTIDRTKEIAGPCYREILRLGLRDQVVRLTVIDEPSRLEELNTDPRAGG